MNIFCIKVNVTMLLALVSFKRISLAEYASRISVSYISKDIAMVKVFPQQTGQNLYARILFLGHNYEHSYFYYIHSTEWTRYHSVGQSFHLPLSHHLSSCRSLSPKPRLRSSTPSPLLISPVSTRNL